METQGEMLVSVTSRMHRAEEEVKNLKRSASREDPISEVIQFCVDEAVKQIVRLNEERKLSVCQERSFQANSDQQGEEEKRPRTSRRALGSHVELPAVLQLAQSGAKPQAFCQL